MTRDVLTRWDEHEHEHGGDRELAHDRPQQVAVPEQPRPSASTAILRVALLNECDRSVQHDDRHHRDTDRDAADDELQQRRHPQQQRQRVRELPCQLSRPLHAPPGAGESWLGPYCARRRCASRELSRSVWVFAERSRSSTASVGSSAAAGVDACVIVSVITPASPPPPAVRRAPKHTTVLDYPHRVPPRTSLTEAGHTLLILAGAARALAVGQLEPS
jgi:hypothetical protein